jgi:hypothetical protein
MSFVRVAPSVAPGRARRLARRRPESNPHYRLGICAIRTSRWSDLRDRLSAGYCERPLVSLIWLVLIAAPAVAASQTAARSGALMRKHHALARRPMSLL